MAEGQSILYTTLQNCVFILPQSGPRRTSRVRNPDNAPLARYEELSTMLTQPSQTRGRRGTTRSSRARGGRGRGVISILFYLFDLLTYAY